jgi:hypothetical protein
MWIWLARHLMGRLWLRVRKNKESITFEYDSAWLENPARFSLEPALNLGPESLGTHAHATNGAPVGRTGETGAANAVGN